jgi:hypothetical protein
MPAGNFKKAVFCICIAVWPALLLPALPLQAADPPVTTTNPFTAFNHDYVLIGLGDSLTQGTMDATINYITTAHGFLNKVHESIVQVQNIELVQPLLDPDGKRLAPFTVPTNLAVGGADVFSIEGFTYGKRVGSGHNRRSSGVLCNGLLPGNFQDLYDKTLYPYNLLQGGPASQIDSAIWLLNFMHRRHAGRAVCVLWIGVNDAANAALASGYNLRNPAYITLPFPFIENVLTPAAAAVLRLGQSIGAASFEPYTLKAIERNLTDPADFAEQYEHALARLEQGVPGFYETTDLFVCTLYDIWASYLFDSNDLEFYLRKLDSQYTVPATFARAPATGAWDTAAPRGDRIGLLTFLCMYALVSTGADAQAVNQILEVDGAQNDGLVLSEGEQALLHERTAAYNDAIRKAVQKRAGKVHLVDIGPWLTDIVTGNESYKAGEKSITGKWGRGGWCTLDGIHPGYTGQTLIANKVIENLNEALGLHAPYTSMDEIVADDPYIDNDGDGWPAGPDYEASGPTGMLFLLKDPDDTDPDVKPRLTADFWNMLSGVILENLF